MVVTFSDILRRRGAAFAPLAAVLALLSWSYDDLAASGKGAKGGLLPTRFEWRYVLGKHWQIVSPAGEEPATTDAAEGNRGACPAGMIEVAGKMKAAAL